MNTKKRIAVVLSGCGVKDGSEIHEAVLTLLAIDRHGAAAHCFAPSILQRDVVDHAAGKATGETRNVLVESARIARGHIRDLATFEAGNFDALVFPGGFGAAKNLCSFAVDGPDCNVEPSVVAAIKTMHQAGKPIGALCIAPVILAKVLGKIEVTIGNDPGTAAAIESMGARHQQKGHGEVAIDRVNKVVTTPCYMLDASISQIAEGADNLVAALLELAKVPATAG
ncbi:isoprenoid biosynthesis glyoxalase ElbB [Telmatospirillum siberiense]|uniref:Isoprenoid biosynthesis protein ElbB n=1 Tax=Telmatospirillum siberiense TaxID=382514 RepID=A0A2N3PUB3_9PROT|nr:isoprenoid biosynthesis glyoxalase ElbB [Telmatospirillum siberiense]PKU23985.1 isoprenoid biosynthesis protein ElbB [Telmatospirillum siberiense]